MLKHGKKIELFNELGKFEEVLNVSESVVELFPDKFEGYHYKFSTLMKLQRREEAEKVLEYALKLFPDDPGFGLDMIFYLVDCGKYAEAEERLDKHYFEAPESSEYAKLKTRLLIRQDKVCEAVEVAEKAIATCFNEELNFYLTSIYFSLENYEKAIATTKIL